MYYNNQTARETVYSYGVISYISGIHRRLFSKHFQKQIILQEVYFNAKTK